MWQVWMSGIGMTGYSCLALGIQTASLLALRMSECSAEMTSWSTGALFGDSANGGIASHRRGLRHHDDLRTRTFVCPLLWACYRRGVYVETMAHAESHINRAGQNCKNDKEATKTSSKLLFPDSNSFDHCLLFPVCTLK